MRFYNTLTKRMDDFVPLKKGVVSMYSCGLTVNSAPHIGHFKRYIMSDILYRYLMYSGFEVKHVMNITDVGHAVGEDEMNEDKLQVKALAENLSPWDVAHKYEEVFLNDLSKLNILRPTIIARATEHIGEMINLIKRLDDNGYLYESSVGMMYDTSKFKTYADFARLDLENQVAGESTINDSERKNMSDFAVWIKNKPDHIMKWDSPWGIGYPGWHIECSAMAIYYLGETIDIHLGGIDHVNVHHTNEIAQSEGATGKKFCNYWMHCGHLQVNSEKMSKSLGNTYGIKELHEKGYSELSFRFMILKTDYKNTFNFTWENLHNAQNEYIKILKQISNIETAVGGNVSEGFKAKFMKAMDSDLNTPLAIAVLHELLASDISDADKYATIVDFDRVLGVNLSNARYILNVLEQLQGVDYLDRQKVQLLLKARNEARKNKDYKKADEIRDEIKSKGYDVLDSKDGSRIELIEYGRF